MASHIPARTKFDNLLLTGRTSRYTAQPQSRCRLLATCSEIVGTEYLAKKIANA